MQKPVIVFVGSSTPIQKLLPKVLEKGNIAVAAVFGSESADHATQEICNDHSIPFLDMKVLRGSSGSEQLAGFKPDWVFNVNSMVLFGDALLNVPTQGSLNLHCGNLPEYAGKHAHQWAIRRGETEFGVTLHWMTSHIDGGDIAGIRMFPITGRDTGLSLYMKYIKEGIPLVEEIIDRIANGEEVPRIAQDQGRRKYFLDREARNGTIPWEADQLTVLNFFRAADYAPFTSPTYVPTTWLGGHEVTMAKAKPAEGEAAPGEIIAIEEKGVVIGTGTQAVKVRKVHLPEGLELKVGDVFGKEAENGE